MKAEDLDELELLLAKYTSWAGPPANSLDFALRRAAPELIRLARLGLQAECCGSEGECTITLQENEP